jgi:hypothetical protein
MSLEHDTARTHLAADSVGDRCLPPMGKRLRRLGLVADLLDHPLIAERYFFPGGRSLAARVDIAVDGAVLACGIHRVDPDAFTVVHFHGNGEVVADWQGVLDRAINRMGWDLLLAEYRGYGGSTGKPLLGKMLDDVGAVIAAAGPPERLVVMAARSGPSSPSRRSAGSRPSPA